MRYFKDGSQYQDYLESQLDSMTIRLQEAEKIISELSTMGMVYSKFDENDDSIWTKAKDEQELQVGASRLQGWTIKVGTLRAAHKWMNK